SESFAALDTGYESSPALVDIDNDGDFDLFAGEFDGGLQFYRNVTPVQVFSETKGNPLSFSLSQNYPNPFNSSTTIAFSLARVSLVKLTLFDITGRQVSVLMDGKLDPGEYKLKFEGGELPSGIYICQVQAENDVQSKKILMLK
ncbi:T9SS type A sorting domain-containing protein, partial [candidate division KSB1 bacterium]|nr:T9SS type A sorting domain-containing protein [candidate division KSB1 bacterium]